MINVIRWYGPFSVPFPSHRVGHPNPYRESIFGVAFNIDCILIYWSDPLPGSKSQNQDEIDSIHKYYNFWYFKNTGRQLQQWDDYHDTRVYLQIASKLGEGKL